ncbi:MAG: 16S rRNA (guanine(966)-N(2))-methyltransferase RsmD [Burkholderiales bacterium]
MKPRTGSSPAQANRVRIIGGTHRSRVLHFPPRPGLRPSPDRVRETLFNWLGQDLTGLTCLDLFAGSGALGFEAASRGAASVTLVERDGEIARALADNATLLQLETTRVARTDALEFLRTAGGRSFDVVFLDPPFGDADYLRLLDSVAPHLNREARVYVEAPRSLDDLPGWTVLRRLHAGTVHAHLMRQATP